MGILGSKSKEGMGKAMKENEKAVNYLSSIEHLLP